MKLPIPLTVLTGYLGSGKTTLLKAMLKLPEMAGTAVIVNEFGEIGLDDALIETVKEDTVLLPSGCVCCAVRGDLVAALLKLHENMMQGTIGPLNRVVLETTGLADPAPIAQTLVTDRDLFRIYRLDGIVTTVDAQHGLDQIEGAYEPARQIAMADRIVLTKSDLVDPAESEKTLARVRTLNPSAQIEKAIKGAISPAVLFDINAYEMRDEGRVEHWLAADTYRHAHHDHAHGHDHDHACSVEHCDHPGHRHHTHLHGIRSFCLTFDKPLDAGQLELAIEFLRTTQGDKLLRVKGILNVIDMDKPFVIQGVQQVFYPVEMLERWPSEDHRSRIVFITKDLDEAKVRTTFAPLLAQETTAQSEPHPVNQD